MLHTWNPRIIVDGKYVVYDRINYITISSMSTHGMRVARYHSYHMLPVYPIIWYRNAMFILNDRKYVFCFDFFGAKLLKFVDDFFSRNLRRR